MLLQSIHNQSPKKPSPCSTISNRQIFRRDTSHHPLFSCRPRSKSVGSQFPNISSQASIPDGQYGGPLRYRRIYLASKLMMQSPYIASQPNAQKPKRLKPSNTTPQDLQKMKHQFAPYLLRTAELLSSSSSPPEMFQPS